MISKKIFIVSLILLFAGMSFVSATDADYNHDGNVDITDVDAKVSDTAKNNVNTVEMQDTENNLKSDVDNGTQVSNVNQSSSNTVEHKQHAYYERSNVTAFKEYMEKIKQFIFKIQKGHN